MNLSAKALAFGSLIERISSREMPRKSRKMKDDEIEGEVSGGNFSATSTKGNSTDEKDRKPARGIPKIPRTSVKKTLQRISVG